MFDSQEIGKIELAMSAALAQFEQEIPRSEPVIMMHLAGHLARQTEEYRSMRGQWMYGLEADLKVLKEGATNRSCFSRTYNAMHYTFDHLSQMERRRPLELPGISAHARNLMTTTSCKKTSVSMSKVMTLPFVCFSCGWEEIVNVAL